jgi:mRNA interferase RelE/StbE
VQRQLRDLTPYAYARIKPAILALAEDPRPLGCRKLRGREGEYRIKVGPHYRVRYTVDDKSKEIEFTFVGLRRDAYDDF